MSPAVEAIVQTWCAFSLIVVWLVGVYGSTRWAECTWEAVHRDSTWFICVALLSFTLWPLVLLAVSGTVAGRAFARWLP